MFGEAAELLPFESGVCGVSRSLQHNPSKDQAAADLLLLTHTRASTRVSQCTLPSPDSEENFVAMLDREKLF